MLKFAQIKTRKLSYLLKAIYKCISVNKQFSRCFGDIEIVFKKRLYRHKSFAVKRLQRSLLENLLQKHLAEARGELIYKPAYSEIIVAYDILLGIKDLSDIKRNLCFLIGARKILDVIDNRSYSDRNLRIEFG